MSTNRLVLASQASAGAIAGIYDVFGTNAGNETLLVYDGTTANLAGDFNRGGDTLAISGRASSFTIQRVGSNAVLTSQADQITVRVPVGVTGSRIVFENQIGQLSDVRTLLFDGTNVVLGTQVVGLASIVVTATQPEPPVGFEPVVPGSSTAQSGRMVFGSGGTASAVAGKYDVFGTNTGNETLTVLDGTSVSLAGDFNRGGDIIRLSGRAGDFVMQRSGSNVVISSLVDDITARIPVGVAGMQVVFQDGAGQFTDTRTLLFTGTNVLLGAQTVGLAAAGVTPLLNSPPVLANAIADQTVAEDTAWSYQLPANAFSDPDGDSLSFAASLGDGSVLPSWLSFNASTRTFSGTPPLNFNGNIDVRVTASDGRESVTDTFRLTITPVNDAPVITSATTAAVDENAPTSTVVYRVTATDVDVGQSLTYALAGADAGLFSINNATGEVRLSGSANYEAKQAYNFTVVVSDGQVTSSQAVTLSVSDLVDNLDIGAGDDSNVVTVDARGDAPNILDVNFQFNERLLDNNDVQIVRFGRNDRLSFDSDINEYSFSSDGSNLIISQNATGTISRIVLDGFLNLSAFPIDPVFVIDPASANAALNAALGTTGVSYLLGPGAPPPVTNTPPVLANLIPDRTVAEDSAWSYVVPTSTFSDADGNTLTYTASLVGGAALPSWLTFNASTRTFSGTPPLNFNGNIDLRVTASDGTASVSDDFRLTVTPVNDAPILANAIADQSVAEDTAWSYVVPANAFSDVDNASLTLSATLASGAALPSWLTFNGSTRTFSGTPPLNFNGNIDLKVTASDGTASISDDFRLTVTPVNDAPVFPGIGPLRFSINENSTNVGSVLASDTDSSNLTFSIAGGKDSALFSISSSTGSISFKSNPDFENPFNSFSNSYTFNVRVSDGVSFSESEVVVDVFNTKETIDVVIDSNFLNPIRGVSATSWSYSGRTGISTSEANGVVAGNVADIPIGGDLFQWFENLTPGSYRISFLAKNDSSNTTVLVYGAQQKFGTSVNTLFSLGLGSKVYLQPNAEFVRVNLDFTVNSDFDFPVNELFFLNSYYSFPESSIADSINPPGTIIRIAEVSLSMLSNSPPVVSNAIADQSVAEDGAWSYVVPSNTFSDVDGATLTLSASLGDGASLPVWLSFNAATRTFSGTPPLNFNGNLDLKVTASDGALSVSDTFRFTVTPVNDAPVITSNGGGALGSVAIPENTTAVISVTATDPDAGSSLVYSIAGGTDAALFQISASTGALTFKTAPNFEAPTDAGRNNIYDVEVQVSDGILTDRQAVAVSVTNQPEAVGFTTLQSSFVPNMAFGGIEVALLDNRRIALVSSNNDIAYATLEFFNLSLLSNNSIAQQHAQVQPSLVSTGNGAFLAFASQPAGFHADEYGFFINADGTKGPTLSLMDNWPGADWEPSLVRFADGAMVMTFISERNGNYDILAQNLNVDGSKSGGLYLASGALPNHQMMFGGDLSAALPGTKLFLQGWRTIPLSGPNVNGPRSMGIALVNAETRAVVQTATIADGLAAFPLSSSESLAVNAVGQGLIFYQSGGSLIYRAFSAGPTGFVLGTTTQAALPISGLVNVDVASVVLPNGNVATAISGTDGGRQYVFVAEVNVATGQISNVVTLLDQSIAAVTGLSSRDFFTDETVWYLPIDIAINGSDIVVAYRDAVRDGVGLATLTYGEPAFNTPPTVANSVADQSVVEDTAWSYVVPANTFTDADGNTLTYTASLASGAALPFWLTFNASARTFTGTPPLNFNDSIDLRVTASDGTASISDEFRLTVTPDTGLTSYFLYNVSNGVFFWVTSALLPATGTRVLEPAETGLDSRLTLYPDGSVTITDVRGIGLLFNVGYGENLIYIKTISNQPNVAEYPNIFNPNSSVAPTLKSNGGGESASISISENLVDVTSLVATDYNKGDVLVYSIIGGVDRSLFTIDAATGVMRFITAPDFERPTDSGANNVYDVEVQVSDGVLFDRMMLSINVLNVSEPGG